MLLIFTRKTLLLWGSSSRNVVKILAVSEIHISIMMEDLEFYSVPLGRDVMEGSKFFRQTFHRLTFIFRQIYFHISQELATIFQVI